jgi:hypothetical protein
MNLLRFNILLLFMIFSMKVVLVFRKSQSLSFDFDFSFVSAYEFIVFLYFVCLFDFAMFRQISYVSINLLCFLKLCFDECPMLYMFQRI